MRLDHDKIEDLLRLVPEFGPDHRCVLRDMSAELERHCVGGAWRLSGFNQTLCAAILGVSRGTAGEMLTRHGLRQPRLNRKDAQ